MRHTKARIFALIADTVGLKVEEAWERYLQERMALVGAADLEAYERLLRSSPQEFQELIERLVVRESWFFRDPAVFDQLIQAKGRPLRLLSVACASGEEPYSLAMALLDAHFSPKEFQIEAVDISKMALLKAKKGLYGNHSFRGRMVEFRDHYFDEIKEGYQLKKEVQGLVHFSYGNICDRQFEERQLYDLIFCRNLLIYLHPAAQRQVLQRCERLLKPDGLLLVAAAEGALVQRYGFLPKGAGRVFRRPEKMAKPPKQKALSIETFPEEIKEVRLEQAELLADEGNFAEAEQLCQEYVKGHVMDAEGHFLLGVIQQAQGKEEGAEGSFLKALYLQPKHEGALLYLILRAEKRGDKTEASRLRRRLK